MRGSHTTFCFAYTMKVVEEKMPSGRRNGATRTMKSRTMPCNVSACSLRTVDQKGFCFSNDFCDAHDYTAHKRNEGPASPSYITILRVAETTSIAETKAVEEKMPSGRRNDATRTMMSRTMPCNVSTCFLSIVDLKKLLFQQRSLRRA